MIYNLMIDENPKPVRNRKTVWVTTDKISDFAHVHFVQFSLKTIFKKIYSVNGNFGHKYNFY